MKVLIIDTATSVFSIALTDNGQVIAEVGGDAGPATSARIPGHISSVLETAHTEVNGLDAFAVTVGPGAFTGVRVGISLIKGLAFATGKPVVPLSSLELLACNVSENTMPVCALFDARKGEVYAAVYSAVNHREVLRPEAAVDPERLVAGLIGPHFFIGDGALRYRELISIRLGSMAHFAQDHLHVPKASAAAGLVHNRLLAGETVSPMALAPRYLRLSEAELNKKL